jgi:hypothetical protein
MLHFKDLRRWKSNLIKSRAWKQRMVEELKSLVKKEKRKLRRQ